MNSEQLTVERGQIAADLIQRLNAENYSFTQEVTEDAVSFEVTHADTPKWCRRLSVAVVTRNGECDKNALYIPGEYRGNDVSKRGIAKLVARLSFSRKALKTIQQRNIASETDAAKLVEQQAKAFAGLEFPDWMNVDVRVLGWSVGHYRVSFEPGSPLERLTAEQVKRLLAVLVELDGQLSVSERALVKDLVQDGLSIQDQFNAEPDKR